MGNKRKEIKKYSVWRMSYNKKYLLTHPWVWFKCAWRCCRDAWRRSVYGWTYGDAWDWYDWFLHVVPDMLRHIAINGSAYPGAEPFDTPEKWRDWLLEMADLLESGDEEWQNGHNMYYEEYKKNPGSLLKVGKTPYTREDFVRKWYMARAAKLSEEGDKNVERAMTEIGKNFFNVWD